MIVMLTSLLIILLSLGLLVYWFRYSCLLLLRTRTSEAVAATDGRFHFPVVQEQLKSGSDLDPLQRSLRRDYEVFIYLVEHASGLSLQSFEDRLLVLDYRILQSWYRLTRRILPRQARRTVSEMADVMSVLVARISQRAGAYIEA